MVHDLDHLVCDGEWEARDVSPQRLVSYRENWYLDCWCHKRNGIRVLALDQMRETRVLDTPAIDVPEEELDQVLKASYGIFTGEATAKAVLRFTPHRAQWVSKEDWHGEQESRWLDDGSYELTIPYGRPEEMLIAILKHGADVGVVGRRSSMSIPGWPRASTTSWWLNAATASLRASTIRSAPTFAATRR